MWRALTASFTALIMTTATLVTAPCTNAAAATTVATYTAFPVPQRLVDTRPGYATADGQSAGAGPVAAGQVLEVVVAGRAGVPADATTVVLDVAVTDPGGPGYLTVWPCGQPRPTTSNLNHAQNQTIANTVIAGIGVDGKVCVFSYATAHVVVDADGWFGSGGYVPLAAPRRIADTRPGQTTIDGQSAGTGVLDANTTLAVHVTARAGVPSSATNAVLNIATTESTGAGFLTVWPCNQSRPTAASLNWASGDNVSNVVVATLDPAGATCMYVSTRTHLVVDVQGWFAPGAFTPLSTPRRAADTRPGEPTADGAGAGAGRLKGGTSFEVPLASRLGVPQGASAVTLNVAVTGSTAAGFLTVWPCGQARPTTSSLNWSAGQTISKAVIAGLGGNGAVCVFAYSDTDVVVDVVGYMLGSVAPADVPLGVNEVDQQTAVFATPDAFTDYQPGGTSTLVYRGDEAVTTSNIIVAVATTDHPQGLIGRVQSVTVNPDGSRTVVTTPGSFTDVIPRFDFTVDLLAGPSKFAMSPRIEDGGRHLQTADAPDASESKPFSASCGASATADYSVNVKGMSLHFDGDVWTWDPWMKATVNPTVEVTADVPVVPSLSCTMSFNHPLANWNTVGPFGIPLAAQLAVVGSATLDVKFGTGGFQQKWLGTGEFGVRISLGDSPQTINSFKFDVVDPAGYRDSDTTLGFELAAGLELTAGVGALDGGNGGVIGLTLEAGLKAKVDHPSDPYAVNDDSGAADCPSGTYWNRVSVGFYGEVGLVAKITIGWFDAGFHASIAHFEVPTNERGVTVICDRIEPELDAGIAPPGGLTATAGNASATLSWVTSPTPTVDGYEVQSFIPQFNRWYTVGRAIGRTTASYQVVDLANNTPARFRVLAYHNTANAKTVSNPAGPVDVTPIFVDPALPTPGGLGSTAGNTTATVNWSAAADTAVTGYRVERYDSATATWILAADVAGRATTSRTFTGLANYTDQKYRVRTTHGTGTDLRMSLASGELLVMPYQPLELTTQDIPRQLAGVSFDVQLATSGGRIRGGATFALVTGQTLPTGLTLSSSGHFAGMSNAPIEGSVNVLVTAASGESITRRVTFNIGAVDRTAGKAYRVVGYGTPGVFTSGIFEEGRQGYFDPLTDAYSVAVGPTGEVYALVAATTNGTTVDDEVRLVAISPDGVTRTIAGGGTSSDPFVSGTSPAAHPSAVGLHFDSSDSIVVRDGKVLFYDWSSGAIIAVDPVTTTWAKAAGGGAGRYDPGDSLFGFRFSGSPALAVAPDGTLYVTDGTYDGPRVLAITLAGTVSHVAGTGAYGWPTNGASATTTPFSHIDQIEVGGGKLFFLVGNGLYHGGISGERVQTVTLTTGVLGTAVGPVSSSCSYTSIALTYSTPLATYCGSIDALAVSSTGHLYVGIGATKLYDASGTNLAWIAGDDGSYGHFTISGELYSDVTLAQTRDMTIDADGDLYVLTYVDPQIGVMPGFTS